MKRIQALKLNKEEFLEHLNKFSKSENGTSFELNQFGVMTVAIYNSTPMIDYSLNNVFVGVDNIRVDEVYQSSYPLIGIHQINDTHILGFISYDDGELPVYRVVYYDGFKLRGYLPINGNNVVGNHDNPDAICISESDNLDFEKIKLELEEVFECLDAREIAKRKTEEFMDKVGADLSEDKRYIDNNGPRIIGVAPNSSVTITVGSDGLNIAGIQVEYNADVAELVTKLKKDTQLSFIEEQMLKDFTSNNPTLNESNLGEFLGILSAVGILKDGENASTINGNSNTEVEYETGDMEYINSLLDNFNNESRPVVEPLEELPCKTNMALYCDEKYLPNSPRYAPQITPEEFVEHLRDYLKHNGETHLNLVHTDSNVKFDCENWTTQRGVYKDDSGKLLGINVFNGIPMLGMLAGGDWECPVFSVTYWDGEKLRMYVPTCGNLFNLRTMEALGNTIDEPLNNDNTTLDGYVVYHNIYNKFSLNNGISDYAEYYTKIEQDLVFDWEWMTFEIQAVFHSDSTKQFILEKLTNKSDSSDDGGFAEFDGNLTENVQQADQLSEDEFEEIPEQRTFIDVKALGFSYLYCEDKYLPSRTLTAPRLSMEAFKVLLKYFTIENNKTVKQFIAEDMQIQKDLLDNYLSSSQINIDPRLSIDSKDTLIGFNSIDGVPFLGIELGKVDLPLVFVIIYFDGSSFRAYVPTCGNQLNIDTGTQFGFKDLESDAKILKEHINAVVDMTNFTNFSVNLWFNWEWIRKDLQKVFNN